MRQNRMERWIDSFILVLTFTFASLRPTFFGTSYPQTSLWFNPGPRAVIIWLVAVALALWILIRNHQLGQYWKSLQKNWFLIAFLFLALLSIAWSILPALTLFSALEALFVTLLGAYIGFRFSMRKLLDILFWVGVVIVLMCFAYVFVAPSAGTMPGAPYNGAWRGFFWHRNHMGSILAFFQMVYLLRLLIGIKEKNNLALLDGIFFLAALVLVVRSRSATGYILTILLDGLLVAGLVWLQVRRLMKPFHYYILGGVVVIAGVLVFTNLDFVFGLFHRSASMTGRTPMWMYLLQNIVTERPWLGHGFGAIWNLESFRLQVQQAVGWDFPVVIADNGFLDILLHLGIIGLLVFVACLVVFAVTIVKRSFQQPSLEGFFPLLVLIYALVANISFSLFLELESFVWLMAVTAFFLSLKSQY